MKPVTPISLLNSQHKAGRIDVLLAGLAKIASEKLENKTGLAGLAEGLMPILEDEIRKGVPSKTVIPKKYQKLAGLVGEYVNRIG